MLLNLFSFVYISCCTIKKLYCNKSILETVDVYIIQENLSTPGVSGVRVARSLVFCVMFLDHCI